MKNERTMPSFGMRARSALSLLLCALMLVAAGAPAYAQPPGGQAEPAARAFPAGFSPYGHDAPNAMYIVSAANGKALEAPIGENGAVTTAAAAAFITATSDYESGDVPSGSAYQFVYATGAEYRPSFVGFASAVKAAGVAYACFEGAFAANKAYTFSRTINGAATPPTAGFSATAWEAWTIKPNGDGTVALVTVNGSSYSRIDPADGQLKSTTNGSANAREANDDEKFVIVPTAVPTAPTGLSYGDVTPVSVTLKWAPPLDGAGRYVYHAGFRVYREAGGSWQEITGDGALAVASSGGSYTFTDDAPVAGATNKYMVSAVSAIGDSSGNPTLEVAVPSSAPPSVKTQSLYFSSFVGGQDAKIDVYLGYGAQAATGLSSIKIDGQALAPATDYALDGTVVTLFAASLGRLAVGSHSIELAFNDAGATLQTVALETAGIPDSANTLIVSEKTGKLVGLPATAPAANTLVATYVNPADAAAQWQLKYSNNGNGMAALRNISSNQLLTVEDNTYGDHMVRARSGNKDELTGGWDCLSFVPAGGGAVKITRVPATCWVTVLDDGRLMSTFDESEAARFVIVPPGVPATPTGFAFEGKTDTQISLSWNSMSTFASELSLLRSENGGEPIAVDISSAEFDDLITGKYQFTDTGLARGATYTYRFAASNARGAAPEGTAVTAATYASAPPVAPSGISIAVDGGNVKIAWEASANADGYNVYRAGSRYGSEFVKLNDGLIAGNAYTDTDTGAYGKWAYYKVSARSEVAESELSDAHSMETEIFGPQTYIFSPEDNQTNVTNAIRRVTANLVNGNSAQFTSERAALLFKPGDYSWLAYENGFYMHSAGLGKLPTDVKLSRVFVSTDWMGSNNATQNFWRAIENMSLTAAGTIMYGVSQAAPMRRLDIPNASMVQLDVNYGWASGGLLADSRVRNQAGSYSQQQFFFRNNEVGSLVGVNWNLVSLGDKSAAAPGTAASITTIASAPVMYEKPFLYFENGDYYVFVPGRREDAVGISWNDADSDAGVGVSQKLDERYYVARSDRDSADAVNAALAAGKNIFFTPGVYRFDKALEVTAPNTVLLGYGLASIIPTAGNNAVNVADVPGVRIAGLIFDAGAGVCEDSVTGGSKALLRVGTAGAHLGFADNPVVLSDIFVRVGGVDTPLPARADTGIEINSDSTIIDHFWVWRSDHGQQVGWNLNKSDYGVVVNGDNVLSYGLFVEHFQKYDVLWNGEYGRVYFLQNEKCYDPPYQQDWVGPDGNGKGWASFRVGDGVVNFEGWGLGCYDVFINTQGFVVLENAMVTPLKGNIKVHNVMQVMISTNGGMEHVINGVGAGSTTQNGLGLGPHRVVEWASEPYADGELVSAAPVAVSTRVGVAPALPAQISVKKPDLTYELRDVAWDAVAPGQYGAEGEFAVEGSVAGLAQKAVANVTVEASILPTSASVAELAGGGAKAGYFVNNAGSDKPLAALCVFAEYTDAGAQKSTIIKTVRVAAGESVSEEIAVPGAGGSVKAFIWDAATFAPLCAAAAARVP